MSRLERPLLTKTIARPPRFPRSLLGLSGVVDKIRILFDGTPTAMAPHGLMAIERI